MLARDILTVGTRSSGGHFTVTATALLEILDNVADGAADFSVAERQLYLVCEVWAAVAARELYPLLGSAPLEFLCNAGSAYKHIGATRVAEVLDTAVRVVRLAPPTARGWHERVRALEETLANTPDPVDRLIARFAYTLVASESSGAHDPSTIGAGGE